MKSKLIKLMFALLLTISGGIGGISVLPVANSVYAQKQPPESKDGKKGELNGLPTCECSTTPLTPDCTCLL